MAFTVLVSFSLLALVVTARPLAPRDVHAEYAQLDVQSAVQAVFESRTKESFETLDISGGEYDIRIISAEEQQAYLSSLDSSAIKALVPLDENRPLTEEEKALIEMLGTSDRMEDVEGASAPLPEDESSLSPAAEETDLVAEEAAEADTFDSASSLDFAYGLPSVHSEPIVIAISCLVAVLALACVGGFLYAVYYVRTYVLGSRTAYDLLPQLEKQKRQDRPSRGTYGLPDDKRQPLGIMPGDYGDYDEKDGSETDGEYEDAQSNDTTPTATPRMRSAALPLTGTADPRLVPLPSSPTQQTRKLADEDSEFGTPASTPRQSAVALPEEDAPNRSSTLDYARQLVPIANPAWVLNFFVAMFGWMAILMGSPREQQPQRRIIAH
ncbi:hypothetical protein PENSPDRAFT_736539 [Peniophora sp. CONT]|nr:hypothetical protein PENSPDRAFT_736539 [Peniophora sp. CONT]